MVPTERGPKNHAAAAWRPGRARLSQGATDGASTLAGPPTSPHAHRDVDPAARRGRRAIAGHRGVRPGPPRATADAPGRLCAEGSRSVLVVLQGLDASGKDGTISRVFRGLNPLGTRVAAFKAPSDEELSHDFLWRVHARCPSRARSRSSTARTTRTCSRSASMTSSGHIWRRRSRTSTPSRRCSPTLERRSSRSSCTCRRRNSSRLETRREDPSKRWKLNDGRPRGARVLGDTPRPSTRCWNGPRPRTAPWTSCQRTDKWYRDWAVSTILVDVLTALDPRYPECPPPRAPLGGRPSQRAARRPGRPVSAVTPRSRPSPATTGAPPVVVCDACGTGPPAGRCRSSLLRSAGEHHLERLGLAGAGEDVVGLLELVEPKRWVTKRPRRAGGSRRAAAASASSRCRRARS